MKKALFTSAALLFMISFFYIGSHAAGEWTPAGGKIMTRWAKDVSPSNALPEYPRPAMVRKDWLNLNGLWDYAIRVRTEGRPDSYDGKILVPFAVESALSGVGKPVGDKNALWYKKEFTVPEAWSGKRVLLHFGACDWETSVWVNGRSVGAHQGGYDPFAFDITDALNGGAEKIVVKVWDPIDAGFQPRGKQVARPESIWYTSVTGIWQTVWLEAVPDTYIESIKVTPDIDKSEVRVGVSIAGSACEKSACTISVKAKDGEKTIGTTAKFIPEKNSEVAAGKAAASGNTVAVQIPGAKLWSPDSPFLYDLEVSLAKSGTAIDSVTSYFGMRKISVAKDDVGNLRLFLNNAPLFQYGPLDQGWWPDGLYTAPTDAALRYDIEILKKLGFNMLRKHVKVEPSRLYYWCDKLGLLVWQDMPSGDRYISPSEPDITRVAQSAGNYERELKAMIDSFYNHPSIIMWVPFNEGWGQFDTPRIVEWTKAYDSSRLVNNTSGWADRGVGDVIDLHMYPGPGMPTPDGKRSPVLGEFGGLGLPVKGHTWQDDRNWGYISYADTEKLTNAYIMLLRNLKFLVRDGLSAAVYTQTSDVEIEVNGLMSYDREILKVDAEKVAKATALLYKQGGRNSTMLRDARREKAVWKYKVTPPKGDWASVDFDDTKWKEGPGGFGDPKSGSMPVGTQWKSDGIWMRRSFDLASSSVSELNLVVGHHQDAKIYINGVLAAEIKGSAGGYEYIPVSAEAVRALKTGRNVIAINARQTVGGHFIDAGLIDTSD